jgi:hypothetical protein
MTRKFISAALVIVLATTTASAANFAHLNKVQGKVLINQGEGFAPAIGDVALDAGDKVMVGKEGSATLSYSGEQGCTVSLAPSTVVTIGKTVPCEAGEVVGAVDSVFVAPARGRGHGRPPGYGSGGAVYVPIVVSVSFAVTVLVSIWIATHNNGGNPVSAP